jgi:hypothetical protein
MRTHIFAVLIAMIVSACASHQGRDISADDGIRDADFTYLEGQGSRIR